MKRSFSFTASSLLAFALLVVPAARAQAAQKAPPAKSSQPQADPLAALVQQANDAITKKDYAAAVSALQNYLAKKPDDATAHAQLAYALTELNRTDEAKAEYRKAISLDPKLAAAQINLGLLLLESEPAAAVEPFRRAAELLPGRARPHALLAEALERNNDATAALAEYETAARLDPKDVEPRLGMGRLLLRANRAADAEVQFREALAIQPGAPRAQLGLAESLMVQKKYDAAAAAFATYLASAPEDRESRREEAGVLGELGKNDQALAELDRADAGGTPALASMKLRAEILMAQKQWPQAQDALQKALALAPQDADLHARLGRVFLAKREYDSAQQELRRALTLDANHNDALRDLATTYYLMKDCPSALGALDLLDRREAPRAGNWFLRATCYDRLDKKRDAIAAYQKFLELDQERDPNQDWQARQRIHVLNEELQRKK